MPDDAPGWYGKIASLGDFAQRRMAPGWVQTCDTWLSRCMHAASAQLGERWFELYLTAPLLHFAWTPGVMDDAWWFGVLMPSCDAAGRYFPLLVAQSGVQLPEDCTAFDNLEQWYEGLARAALHTLHEHTTLEIFEAMLAELQPWPPTADQRASPPTSLAEQMNATAVRGLSQLRRQTLWWRAGGEIRILPGLPSATAFIDLLARATDPA